MVTIQLDQCDLRREVEQHRVDQDAARTILDATPPSDDDIAALLDMSDNEYNLLVAETIDTDNTDDWAALLAQPVRKRTLAALGRLLLIVQQELTHARTLPGQQQYRRRIDCMNRKERLERRVRQVKWLHTREHEQRVTSVHDAKTAQTHALRVAVDALATAIHEHRMAAVIGGLEPEPADTALWATLAAVQIPHGDETVTVAEALRRKFEAEAAK